MYSTVLQESLANLVSELHQTKICQIFRLIQIYNILLAAIKFHFTFFLFPVFVFVTSTVQSEVFVYCVHFVLHSVMLVKVWHWLVDH